MGDILKKMSNKGNEYLILKWAELVIRYGWSTQECLGAMGVRFCFRVLYRNHAFWQVQCSRNMNSEVISEGH